MRSLLSLVLLASVLALAAEAALFTKGSKVTLLNRNNFKQEVLDIDKPTMVAFTAPWCGHCQRLVPDYTKVAQQLDGVVKLASVDCDDEDNKPLCGKYGIQGFPTLKLFPPTKKRLPKDYQGPRTAKDIAAFMVDALPMSVKKLKAEELQEYTDKDVQTPKVILFSKKPTSSPLYKSLALDFRKSLTFAFLRGDQQPVKSAARIHLGVTVHDDKLPTLIVVPGRDEDQELDKSAIKVYQGQLKYHELNAWIKDNVPEAKSGKAKKTKPKAQPKPKPIKLDEHVQDLPVGAQREWRVEEEMTEEERLAKMEKLAEMINSAMSSSREQASATASSVAHEAKQTAAKVADDVKQKVFDAGAQASEAVNKASEKVEQVKETVKDTAGKAYDAVKQKVFDASAESVDEAASAHDSPSSDSTSSSHSWSSSSSYSSSDDGQGNVVSDREVSYSTSTDGDESSYKVSSHQSGSGDVGGSGDKISLKENLQKWLEGEQVDWSSDYATQFKDAQSAAEKLIRENPEQAEQMALQSERWLAEHLISDLEMMRLAKDKGSTDQALTDEKIERVEKMYNELLVRIKEREQKLQSQDKTKDADGSSPNSVHDEL